MSNVIYLSANGRELRAEIRARIDSGQITQADLEQAIKMMSNNSRSVNHSLTSLQRYCEGNPDSQSTAMLKL